MQTAAVVAILTEARADAHALCLTPTERIAHDLRRHLESIRCEFERDRELGKALAIIAPTSQYRGPIEDLASDMEHDARIMLDDDPDAPSWPSVRGAR